MAIHACLLDERQFAGDTPDEVLSVWRGAAFIVNNNSGQGQAETTPRAVATRPQKGFDVIESERFVPCAFRNSYRKTSGQQRQAKELLETHIYTLFSFFSFFPLCNRVEAGHGEYPQPPRVRVGYRGHLHYSGDGEARLACRLDYIEARETEEPYCTERVRIVFVSFFVILFPTS